MSLSDLLGVFKACFNGIVKVMSSFTLPFGGITWWQFSIGLSIFCIVLWCIGTLYSMHK